MHRKLKIGMIVFGGVLLLGVLALALIPTPEDELIRTGGTATQQGTGTTGRLSDIVDDTPEFSVNPSQKTGVIEGTLTYLDTNDIPAGLKVCAVNQKSFQETCTTDLLKTDYYTYGTGYRLELDAGEYTVYSQAPDDEYRAYYTPFVVCGHREGCNTHTPERVVVSANSVSQNVDPKDWSESPLLQ